MARRISPSQLQSKIRQLQSQQRRAIDDYNRKVRAYNQAVDKVRRDLNRSIDNYNREVRAHNSRVRANRARYNTAVSEYNRAVRRLSSSPYSTSVVRVRQTYDVVESRADQGVYEERANAFLDLAEREAANSLDLANRIAADSGESPATENLEFEPDPNLLAILTEIGVDLAGRWKGALFSLNPRNPDAARHFCTSARELFSQILAVLAPDAVVQSERPSGQVTPQGTPTRRSKISYLLSKNGISDEALTEFIESDVDNVISLFGVFNDGTHGSVGTFSFETLKSIKQRVENGLEFLCRLRSIS